MGRCVLWARKYGTIVCSFVVGYQCFGGPCYLLAEGILHQNIHLRGNSFLLITNLTQFFMYLFISPLYMFRASRCLSSGDRIVLTF